MPRLLLKLLIACAIALAGFYGYKVGMDYRFAQQAGNCTTPDGFELALRSPAGPYAGQASRIFACIKAQQNALDRFHFAIPDAWTRPTGLRAPSDD